MMKSFSLPVAMATSNQGISFVQVRSALPVDRLEVGSFAEVSGFVGNEDSVNGLQGIVSKFESHCGEYEITISEKFARDHGISLEDIEQMDVDEDKPGLQMVLEPKHLTKIGAIFVEISDFEDASFNGLQGLISKFESTYGEYEITISEEFAKNHGISEEDIKMMDVDEDKKGLQMILEPKFFKKIDAVFVEICDFEDVSFNGLQALVSKFEPVHGDYEITISEEFAKNHGISQNDIEQMDIDEEKKGLQMILEPTYLKKIDAIFVEVCDFEDASFNGLQGHISKFESVHGDYEVTFSEEFARNHGISQEDIELMDIDTKKDGLQMILESKFFKKIDAIKQTEALKVGNFAEVCGFTGDDASVNGLQGIVSDFSTTYGEYEITISEEFARNHGICQEDIDKMDVDENKPGLQMDLEPKFLKKIDAIKQVESQCNPAASRNMTFTSPSNTMKKAYYTK